MASLEAHMSAHEPADRSEERTPSMRDLLAACAAADAVSTPPKDEEPEPPTEESPERDAA
ncbi:MULTISPECIES: hypothetical protein [Streptomyces]|uniref:Uncharacterized protein n=1 Tax=Streptomyces morookaense TaxID=1970 RepID=A0A7Y7B5X7_STRMO|nr:MULTISPECIES: hypothetical protein [Streptomyces]MCC2279603.1 hypothetical protein [Streptomyces sp. ET3-23]NVK79641.1 hypothetical protein [Streptomyces morookaense]